MIRTSLIMGALIAVSTPPVLAQDGQFDAAGSLLQGGLSQQIVDGQNRRVGGASRRRTAVDRQCLHPRDLCQQEAGGRQSGAQQPECPPTLCPFALRRAYEVQKLR